MNKEKKPFNWNSGEVLSNDDFIPEVRQEGYSHLSKAPAADPQLRKKERVKKLKLSAYKTLQDKSDANILVEESVSGLRDTSVSTKDSEHMLDTGDKMHGFDRFKSLPKKKGPSEK